MAVIFILAILIDVLNSRMNDVMIVIEQSVLVQPELRLIAFNYISCVLY